MQGLLRPTWLVEGVEHWLVDGVERWLVGGVEHWLVDGVEHFDASTAISTHSGTFSNEQSITLSLPDCQFYYTTDGTAPAILIGDDGKALFDDNGYCIIMDGE
jgi:hypothetical protein